MYAVQCDNCGKFAANPLRRSASQKILPADWWLVTASKNESYSEEASDFCSRDCVSQHFAKPEAV